MPIIKSSLVANFGDHPLAAGYFTTFKTKGCIELIYFFFILEKIFQSNISYLGAQAKNLNTT